MKKIVLLAFLAISIATLGSCGKLTNCNCPSGKILKVNGGDADAIRNNCEYQSNGVCTY